MGQRQESPTENIPHTSSKQHRRSTPIASQSRSRSSIHPFIHRVLSAQKAICSHSYLVYLPALHIDLHQRNDASERKLGDAPYSANAPFITHGNIAALGPTSAPGCLRRHDSDHRCLSEAQSPFYLRIVHVGCDYAKQVKACRDSTNGGCRDGVGWLDDVRGQFCAKDDQT